MPRTPMPFKWKVKIRKWSFDRFARSVKEACEREREEVKFHVATAKRCYHEKFTVRYTVVTLARYRQARGRLIARRDG